MTIAKVFQSGNSQAVRLPKQFRFKADQVEILRRGNEIILREYPLDSTSIFETLAGFPEDMMSHGRDDILPQERESL